MPKSAQRKGLMKRIVVGAVLALGALVTMTSPAMATTTTVYSWGTVGQHGGSAEIGSSPVPISLPGPASQVVGTNSASYALVQGAVYAWGKGGVGELGNGANHDSITKPVKVLFPPGVTISAIANPGSLRLRLSLSIRRGMRGVGGANSIRAVVSRQHHLVQHATRDSIA